MLKPPRFRFIANAVVLLALLTLMVPPLAIASVPRITCRVKLSRSKSPQEMAAIERTATEAGNVAREWYPKAMTILGITDHRSPQTYTIEITDDSATGEFANSWAFGEPRTLINAEWALKNPGDIAGLEVHELTHVVTQYKSGPSWLLEAVCDYVRWFNYEPQARQRYPKASEASDACRRVKEPYATGAAFLHWLTRTRDRYFVQRLDRALYTGTYSDSTWVKLTGQSLDQLIVEWEKSLRAQR